MDPYISEDEVNSYLNEKPDTSESRRYVFLGPYTLAIFIVVEIFEECTRQLARKDIRECVSSIGRCIWGMHGQMREFVHDPGRYALLRQNRIQGHV
jgi:hypothetical protein